MATYTVNTSAVTLRSGCKCTFGSPNDTYVRTRMYLKFDLSSYGIVLSTIDTVVLETYVKTIYQSGGGGTSGPHDLYSGSAGDNWGTTLQANAADFNSTVANLEDSKTISSTGWLVWAVNKNNLNLSGTTYFKVRLTAGVENGTGYEYVDFYSQNNATLRPVLRITLKSGRRIFVVT